MSAARRISFRIASAAVVFGAIAIVPFAVQESYEPVRTFVIARGSGWLAASLLTLALCVSPLRWLRRALDRPEIAWFPALRRSLGIAAAGCALAHAGFSLARVPGLYESLASLGWLRAGLSSLALLCVLLVTSFDEMTRRLRLQHWRLLHWLAYPAALAACLHALLGPFGRPALELTLTFAIVVLLATRMWRVCKRAFATDES